MNLRLDFELLMKRHALRGVAALVLISGLGVAGAYVYWASPGDTLSTPVDDSDRLIDERYRAFHSLLIPQQELDARQQAVIQAAIGQGLQAGRIDYGIMPPAQGSRFRVATLTLPLRGTYKDFRAFITAVLADHPALAIEDLSIQRTTHGPQVEARLRLAFYATAEESRP